MGGARTRRWILPAVESDNSPAGKDNCPARVSEADPDRREQVSLCRPAMRGRVCVFDVVTQKVDFAALGSVRSRWRCRARTRMARSLCGFGNDGNSARDRPRRHDPAWSARRVCRSKSRYACHFMRVRWRVIGRGSPARLQSMVIRASDTAVSRDHQGFPIAGSHNTFVCPPDRCTGAIAEIVPWKKSNPC